MPYSLISYRRACRVRGLLPMRWLAVVGSFLLLGSVLRAEMSRMAGGTCRVSKGVERRRFRYLFESSCMGNTL